MSETPGTHMLAPKLLICSVDGGWFGIGTDWVETVCPRASVSEQMIRVAGRRPQPFVVFQGQPALVAELRSVVGLEGNDDNDREHYVLVRTGHMVVAVPVDSCVGIRTVDLHGRAPVPSRVVRDGGMPIGHLVELDGRMLMVLDPTRLLDASERGLWKTAVRRAEATKRRLAKLDSLWTEIRQQPSANAIRSYASLCSRSGRTGTAAAARALLTHLSGNADAGDGQGNVIRQLLDYSEQKRSGRMVVDGNGSGEAHLELIDGRLVNVRLADRHGRAALAQLLATPCRSAEFVEVEASIPLPATGTSTAAVLIEALESVPADRRKRRGNAA
ncbi:MAG TPA: chemotaxis protein CheW [Terriglobales bacterium]|nr:chemotaxis protein CheW [Terriglobales bacterium]